MIEDRTGIGQLLKERIARFRRILVHKLSAKEISVGTIKEKVSGSGISLDDDIKLPDNKSLILGTGSDAKIYYDSADLNIDPAVVGSGVARINGAFDVTGATTLSAHLTMDASAEIRLQTGGIIDWPTGTGQIASGGAVHIILADDSTAAALTTTIVGDLRIQGPDGASSDIKGVGGATFITLHGTAPHVRIPLSAIFDDNLQVKGSGTTGGISLDRGGADSPDLKFVGTNTWWMDNFGTTMRWGVGGAVYMQLSTTPQLEFLSGAARCRLFISGGATSLHLLATATGIPSIRISRPTTAIFAGEDWVTGNDVNVGWSQQLQPNLVGFALAVDRAATAAGGFNQNDPTIVWAQQGTGRVGIGDLAWADSGSAPNATLHVEPFATTDVGFLVHLVASHSANGLEVQDSADAVVASIGADGKIYTVSDLEARGRLSFGSVSEVTITAGGAITITKSYHTVDTANDDATDDLDTINGGANGGILVLRAADSGRTVVMKNGTGNLTLAGDFSLDNAGDSITLLLEGAAWFELSRSDNAA